MDNIEYIPVIIKINNYIYYYKVYKEFTLKQFKHTLGIESFDLAIDNIIHKENTKMIDLYENCRENCGNVVFSIM